METTPTDARLKTIFQSQEAATRQIDDSHFQLSIRSSNGRLGSVIADKEALKREGDAASAVIDDNDSISSWEKVELSSAHQVPSEHAHQREDGSCNKNSGLPVVDYDVFFDDIVAGNLTAIAAALDMGANIEQECDEGVTPLVLAIINLKFDAIRLLLERGAAIDHPTEGVPPIVHALGTAHEAPRIMKLLIEYGADPRVVSGCEDMNALHWAAIFGMVDAVNFLAEVGLNLDGTCSMGRTPLTLAAEKGHTMVVKLLLVKGAELARQSQNGGTALTWAAYYGRLETVRYLLEEGLDINHADNAGLTALAVASNAGYCEMVEFLISKGANVNTTSILPEHITPVTAAALTGHTDVVTTLLRSGADLQLPDQAGVRTLDGAMRAGHMNTVKVLLEYLGGPEHPKDSVALQIAMADTRNAAVSLMNTVSLMFQQIQSQPKDQREVAWIEWVLQQGGNLVAPKAISVMMHTAMESLDRKIVKELLRLGADPNMNLPGRHDQTPLAIAVELSDIDLVRTLLMYGADPAARVETFAAEHHTALQEAIEILGKDKDDHNKAAIFDLLLSDGRCKINQGENTRYTAFSLLLRQSRNWEDGPIKALALKMVDITPDINEERTTMGTGSTLLHVAVDCNHYPMITHLLQKGADINATGDFDQTPLLCCLSSPTSPTMVPFLVAQGANTALHIAARYCPLPTLRFPLDAGLNINAMTSYGYTPLMLALCAKRQDVALYLIERGAAVDAAKFPGNQTLRKEAECRNLHRVVARLRGGQA